MIIFLFPAPDYILFVMTGSVGLGRSDICGDINAQLRPKTKSVDSTRAPLCAPHPASQSAPVSILQHAGESRKSGVLTAELVVRKRS